VSVLEQMSVVHRVQGRLAVVGAVRA
jgi:hypothetical protein